MITVDSVQQYLDGKKQMLASLGAAIAGTLTVLANFAQGGKSYLLNVPSTPEFLLASGGWIGFFNALHGQKVRAENAVIIEKVGGINPSSAFSNQPAPSVPVVPPTQ